MTDGPTIPPPPPATGGKSLIDRVRDILIKPADEWNVIDSEPATVAGIYTKYVMILAAIPPLALAIGLLLFIDRPSAAEVEMAQRAIELARRMGQSHLVDHVVLFSTTSIIVGALIQYALSLASVYVMALIIDGLAPSFGSTKDPLKAFKVAAYYPTAYWVAGILFIIPAIGALAFIAGLYGLYILYLGLPKLMRTPQDKVIPYFAVTLIVSIVVLGIANFIAAKIIYGGFI